MKGQYRKFFMRQMPDVDVYRREIRPMLECISAAREPLPLGMLAQATEARPLTLRAQLAITGSLFPIRAARGSDQERDTVVPFHKSVRDWLVEVDPKTRAPPKQGTMLLISIKGKSAWPGHASPRSPQSRPD